jgi:hypothetical protein
MDLDSDSLDHFDYLDLAGEGHHLTGIIRALYLDLTKLFDIKAVEHFDDIRVCKLSPTLVDYFCAQYSKIHPVTLSNCDEDIHTLYLQQVDKYGEEFGKMNMFPYWCCAMGINSYVEEHYDEIMEDMFKNSVTQVEI